MPVACCRFSPSATAQAASGKLAEIRARGTLVVSVKNDAKHPHMDPAHFDKRGFDPSATTTPSCATFEHTGELKRMTLKRLLPYLLSTG